MTVVSSVHVNPRSRAERESRTAGYGQIVLVLQGGGALGAYQSGVYHALHEAGVEPDWVIGTSIGAINAALIVGNEPDNRLAALQEFWHRVTKRSEVASTVQTVRASGQPALIDFRVEKEEAVYPMVPAGADLHAMIRRPAAEEGVIA